MLEVGSWWPRGAAVSELGEGPSRLSIWGTVVLSTEGTAHLADPQQVYTWPAHVHGGSASYAGLGGLLWALKLFLPGARGFWTRDASGWVQTFNGWRSCFSKVKLRYKILCQFL